MRRVWLFLLMAVGVSAAVPAQSTALVVVRVADFPVPNGFYTVEGDYSADGWNTSLRSFPVVGGTGASAAWAVSGPGPELMFSFTITRYGTWERHWNGTAGRFGVTEDRESGLNMFVVPLPLDNRLHTVDLSFPPGFVLPRLTVDGQVPSSLVLDDRGRIIRVRRPGADGTARWPEEFSYRDDGGLLTWKRNYGYPGSSVESSVLTYDGGGFLVQAEDRYRGWTLVRTFAGKNRDFNLNPLTGLEEHRPDGVLTLGSVAQTGARAWDGLTFVPTGGSPRSVPLSPGTVSSFQGYFEGWSAVANLWGNGDLSLATSLVPDPTDPDRLLLEASFAGKPSGGGKAYFRSPFPRLRDWTPYTSLQVTASNPGTSDLRLVLAAETGEKSVWQETSAGVLPAGSTVTLTFPLDRLMSLASGWEAGTLPLADGDQVGSVSFIVLGITDPGVIRLADLGLVSPGSPSPR